MINFKVDFDGRNNDGEVDLIAEIRIKEQAIIHHLTLAEAMKIKEEIERFLRVKK